MAVGTLLASWSDRLFDLFFPPRCVGCGREGRFLCSSCVDRTPGIATPWCAKCGQHLAAGASCQSCAAYPLSLEGIRSAYAYEPPLIEAITQFKYHSVRAMGEEMGELLGRFLTLHPLAVDVIVPVPLHPTRRRERGYNQAELLCVALGHRLGIPLAPDALRRVRNTLPQAHMDSTEDRRLNVAGAFTPGVESVDGKGVLLVDDVCTTGATLSACGDALNAAGAAVVWGLTLARAERPAPRLEDPMHEEHPTSHGQTGVA